MSRATTDGYVSWALPSDTPQRRQVGAEAQPRHPSSGDGGKSPTLHPKAEGSWLGRSLRPASSPGVTFLWNSCPEGVQPSNTFTSSRNQGPGWNEEQFGFTLNVLHRHLSTLWGRLPEECKNAVSLFVWLSGL